MPHVRSLGWLAVAALVLFLAARLGAAEPPPGPPDATKVIARGPEQLVDALNIALHPAWEGDVVRPVAFIVDVSPNTKAASDKIARAFDQLAVRRAPSWSLAPLGGKFAAPVDSPAGLGTLLPKVVAHETEPRSTLEALRKTLKSLKPKGAVVVYLADWRFEDDCDLEKFLKGLRRRQTTFSVVGSEAAFERGWNDGVKEPGEDIGSLIGILDRHLPGVGRDPFGKQSHKAPWHGGETAYPQFAYRFDWELWKTAFSAFDWERADLDNEAPELDEQLLEDLRKRLGERPPTGERPPGLPPGLPWPPEGGDEPLPTPEDDGLTNREKNIRYPLPSAFGPYGLMRLAGETGGRYVLFSWNPKGRRKVKYEYKRCNLFPPDLRPRAEILKGLRRNPWASALLRSWSELLAVDDYVIEIRAPLKGGRTPQSIDRLPYSSGFDYLWHNKGEYKQFLRNAPRVIAALDKALAPLDTALETAAPTEPVLRRYEADALYFRHALRCVRFSIAEALAAAKELPKDAFKKRREGPVVNTRTWVGQGRDPEKIRPSQDLPFDMEAARALLAERKQLLARFRGTPFGEQLALNQINTRRLGRWTEGGPPPGTGLSPTESTDPNKPKTGRAPAGGSGGGGPTTGK